MIEIIQDGVELVVSLTSGYEAKQSRFSLRWNAGTEWACSLLVWHLRRRLEAHIEKTRKEAYAAGWKAAKAKTKKQTWFSCRFAELP
jgi:hypothetical protein